MPITNAMQCEQIADKMVAAGWVVVVRLLLGEKVPWIVHATCGDGRRFIIHSDDVSEAFVELENLTLKNS